MWAAVRSEACLQTFSRARTGDVTARAKDLSRQSLLIVRSIAPLRFIDMMFITWSGGWGGRGALHGAILGCFGELYVTH